MNKHSYAMCENEHIVFACKSRFPGSLMLAGLVKYGQLLF